MLSINLVGTKKAILEEPAFAIIVGYQLEAQGSLNIADSSAQAIVK